MRSVDGPSVRRTGSTGRCDGSRWSPRRFMLASILRIRSVDASVRVIRIKVVQTPTIRSIDGIRLDRFELGHTYEFGNIVGELFLAERWGEPAAPESPPPPLFDEHAAIGRVVPPNLFRDPDPPYRDGSPRVMRHSPGGGRHNRSDPVRQRHRYH